MALDTNKWTCRICATRHETIDKPKHGTCYECIGAVAERLCHEALGVSFESCGVDSEYWLRTAERLVAPMLARYQLPPGMAVPTVAVP